MKPLVKKKNLFKDIQTMGFFYKNDVPEGCGILFPITFGSKRIKSWYNQISMGKNHILERYNNYSSYMKKEYLSVVLKELKNNIKEFNGNHNDEKGVQITESIESHLIVLKICGIIWFLTEIGKIPNDNMNGTMFGYGEGIY